LIYTEHWLGQACFGVWAALGFQAGLLAVGHAMEPPGCKALLPNEQEQKGWEAGLRCGAAGLDYYDHQGADNNLPFLHGFSFTIAVCSCEPAQYSLLQDTAPREENSFCSSHIFSLTQK
jgi:hypothetical protein